MAESTLSAIRTKVRRLTRSPSSAQITDTQIDEYVNTAYEQDLPATLKLKSLRKTFTFYTEPNVAQYPSISTDAFPASSAPMADFKNKNLDIESPLFVAGYRQTLLQSRDNFYTAYPLFVNKERRGTGNGVNNQFTGTLTSKPVLQNQVLISSVDVNGDGLSMVDVPVVDSISGLPTQNGNFYLAGSEPTTPPTAILVTNTINYVTGVYTVTFPIAPGNGELVNSQAVAYSAGRPVTVLFYDNAFEFRPVPDDIYRVEMDVYVQPMELDVDNDVPELNQYWQYLAYLAAKKIFEDRMDMDSIQMIMPELKNQERLVLRRTVVNQTKERTSTIYDGQAVKNGGYWWGQNF